MWTGVCKPTSIHLYVLRTSLDSVKLTSACFLDDRLESIAQQPDEVEVEARRYKVSRDDLDLIISVIKPDTCPESESEGFGGSSESISMEKSDSTEQTPQWAHAFQHKLSSSNSGQ